MESTFIIFTDFAHPQRAFHTMKKSTCSRVPNRHVGLNKRVGLNRKNYPTAWTREIAPRGGYPLGLIEYMIERVYQVFCHLNYRNLAFFWICINPKGYPPLTFHQPKFFGGYPPLTFHQPKGFLGVPTSDFSSTQRFNGGYPPLTFHENERWVPPKTFGLMKSQRWGPQKNL